MKKYFFFIVFLICFHLSYYAQFFVGLRGGGYINDYAVKKSAHVSREPLNGWNIGIPINIKLNNTFSLQPEVNYSHISVYLNGFADGSNYTETRRTYLNYLEVPVLLRTAIGGKKLRFFGLLGPHIAYMLNGKDSYTRKYAPFGAPVQLSGYNLSEGSQKRLQRFDTGMQLGAGVSFKVAIGYLSIDARWVRGFVPVNKTSVGFNIYNSGLFFGAAYVIKLF